MGEKFFDKSTVKFVLISLIVAVVSPAFWLLISDFFSSFLPSSFAMFSQWTASLFRAIVVCPHLIMCYAPSKGLFLTSVIFACLLAGLLRLPIFSRAVNVVFFCVIVYALASLSASHIRFYSAASYYEKYCWADFQVSEFSSDKSEKFQRQMSNVETVADINAILSEMAEYVEQQLRQHNTGESADETTDENSTTDSTVI